jgi:spore coat polysaccharide biosynthesis protein SpsF
VIIVQARMGSKRLPGKVMKPLCGKPMIDYLAERLEHARLRFRVAWPHSVEGVEEDDVAGRFREVLTANSPVPFFVRICADSPLIDPALIIAAAGLFGTTGAKLVNNPRYPHGQQVEVIDTQYFLEREPLMTEPQDREHVTPYLYHNAKPGQWVEFHCNRDMRFDVSMAVDTQADFDRMERVIKRMERMGRSHTDFGWQECLRLAWEEANTNG